MSTRSDIIVYCQDDKWRRVYCHSDGYLEHNGRILFDHYTSRDQCDALVAGGGMSVLGASTTPTGDWALNCERTHPNAVYFLPKNVKDSFQTRLRARFKGRCRYYKDRVEGGRREPWYRIKPREGNSLFEVWPEAETWTEYTYVFADRGDGSGFKWWVGDPDTGTQCLRDLGAVLAGEVAVEASVKVFGVPIGQHRKRVNPRLDTRDEANR